MVAGVIARTVVIDQFTCIVIKLINFHALYAY